MNKSNIQLFCISFLFILFFISLISSVAIKTKTIDSAQINSSNLSTPSTTSTSPSISPSSISFSEDIFSLSDNQYYESKSSSLKLSNEGVMNTLLYNNSIETNKIDVLVIHNDVFDWVRKPRIEEFRQGLLKSDEIGRVDLITWYDEPSLELLKKYDVIVVTADFIDGRLYDSAPLWGNAIADFADAGGGVVLGFAMFSIAGRTEIGGNLDYGKIDDPEYGILKPGHNSWGYDTLGSIVYPYTPLMDNVNTLTSSYDYNGAAFPGVTVVAQYAYGPTLIAFHDKEYGRIVGVNCHYVYLNDRSPYYDMAFANKGDFMQLYTNAVIFSSLDDDGDGVLNIDDKCPDTFIWEKWPIKQNVSFDGCICSQRTIVFRNCPTNKCEGENWVEYPTSGNDTCTDGVLTQHSCIAINSTYNSECDPDDDNDGVFDENDYCSNTPQGEVANEQGCSCSQLDLKLRTCSADTCNGEYFLDYPDSNYDTCENGIITEHNCSLISKTYNSTCDLDDDNDGVLDINDLCANTILPDKITKKLLMLRYADIDSDLIFETLDLRGRTQNSIFSLKNTYGCSCNQILAQSKIPTPDEKMFGCKLKTIVEFMFEK